MNFNNISFILHKPQLSENIGLCARGMKNFGFKNLSLIEPKPIFPNDKIKATSVGANDILKKARIFQSIKDATKNYDIIYSSSARKRDINKKHLSFEKFIESIKKNKNKKIGILFGPEASGLSNKDISYSNYIFKIPVSKKFESLNLSHSLIIVCFELFKIIKPSFFNKQKKLNDIASKKKFNIFFDFLQTSLERKGFFVPTEKKKAMLINLRNIFGRIELSNKELRILSSVFSKL